MLIFGLDQDMISTKARHDSKIIFESFQPALLCRVPVKMLRMLPNRFIFEKVENSPTSVHQMLYSYVKHSHAFVYIYTQVYIPYIAAWQVNVF